MNLDEQGFPIITPYSTNINPMNRQQLPQDHITRHTPRQYTAVSKFQDNYNNGTPPSSMMQNTPRYPETSRTIKEEQDLNTYLYPSTDFRGEMNLNVHHPIHPDQNTIRYHPPHNLYPSDLDNPNTGGLAMSIDMSSSRLESSEARLVLGPAKTGSTDFRYQMRALQSQQHQRHQHRPLPHHQQQQNPDLQRHMQASPAFYPLSMGYSSLDQEHSPGGALDRQSQSQLSSVEYDPMESHAQHVSVPAMVYGSLSHEPTTVPGHSQQGVRHDATLNHRGSLASMKGGKNPGSGSYHTTNSPSSIPMSNNKHNHGTTTPSMNTSVPGVHTSSSFSMGHSNNSRWVGHPLSFDMAGSSSGATSVHGPVPTLSSTPAPTSASSSLIRPVLRHSDSGNRSSPENSFTQPNSRLHASTIARTLSSSQSTHSHTSSPSPRLSDNESTVDGRELVSQGDQDSDQAVDTEETVVRMSEKSSAGKKKVIGAEEVGESFLAPIKKKKKSKMHRCEVCGKKFPRPSGLRTHMNTHNNEKPYPCGFPGCTRTFGVRSNAKRHLRTHGVFPTPAANPSSTDYVVGFFPPMTLATQSSSHQLHSVDGGENFTPGFRLLGDNGNIHTQDQGQSDVQHTPLLKLRWMPPSLTTRTNAESLREVRDRRQVHGMGECVEEEEEDDFIGGSGARHTGRGGYGINMRRDDMDDGVEDGDEVEFGENIPRLSIPLRPVVPSSSSNAVATSSSRTMSCPAGCMCSPPCSGPSTHGRRRSSHSSSRTFTSSISPIPSTSFHKSNNSLSPSSMSAYTQREIEMTGVGDGGGGGGVYTRARTNSQQYDIRETTTEERNSYLEAGSHPYHPSQFCALPGPAAVANPTPSTTVLFSRGKEVRYPLVS